MLFDIIGIRYVLQVNQVQADYEGNFSMISFMVYFYFISFFFFGSAYSGGKVFWQPGGAVVSNPMERESRGEQRCRPVRQNIIFRAVVFLLQLICQYTAVVEVTI